MNSSFQFTYKGRKTAWYVFKQLVVLLVKGEAWFRVNFTGEREKRMMDAAEAAGLEYDFAQSTGQLEKLPPLK